MAPQTEYVLVNPDDPCPCQSGKITAACCMADDGSFRVKIPSALPPGEVSGISNPNCYMQDTQNCSWNSAPAHLLSNQLLQLLQTRAVSVHFPWDHAGRQTIIGDLRSNVLCSRHDGALSSLDGVAMQAFANILGALNYVTMKSLATKRAVYAVSGEGLELWALKLLFGAWHAIRAVEGNDVLNEFPPPNLAMFQAALARGALSAPCGFYVRRASGWGASAGGGTDRVSGLRFEIGPLECEVIADPAGLNLDAVRLQNFYRPCGIDLTGKKRGAYVHLSGEGFGANEQVRLKLWEAHA